MANTINADANGNIQAVAQIHNEVSSFIKFIEGVQSAIGTDYSRVIHLPVIITNLISSRVNFDALNMRPETMKAILEKNHGYDNWTSVHTADFNAIFTKAVTLRTAVEDNISDVPVSYANNKPQYVTASPRVRTALNNLISDILISVA